jgi:hypothetical protein
VLPPAAVPFPPPPTLAAQSIAAPVLGPGVAAHGSELEAGWHDRAGERAGA